MSAGYKSTKLASLPTAWVPPYFTVSSDNVQSSSTSDLALSISSQCKTLKFSKAIIRSSAVDENLNERGRFTSVEIVDINDLKNIAECIDAIKSQAIEHGVQMALVVQQLITPERKGHFSNERRVSATRNQWEIEIEFPKYESTRTNSQRDAPAKTDRPLTILDGRPLQRLFGTLGAWANASFEGRVHIEWVLDHGTLWIVQLDLEDDAPDDGIDPREILGIKSENLIGQDTAKELIHWSDFAGDDFRKIAAIKSFASHTRGQYPNIFVLRSEDITRLLSEKKLSTVLRENIGERLVCRTDIKALIRGNMQGLNLPRTDTSSPEQVCEFIEKNFSKWSEDGIAPNDLAFIIHEYIPAVTGVWADAAPDQRTVNVDSLWGLPDGLQYLDHDSFEYDLQVEQIVSEYVRHKAWFVFEDADGTWRRRKVRRDISRHSSISREHISEIAQITFELAKAQGTRLRVMWFVDVKKAGVASLFPWFAHKPEIAENGLFSAAVQDQSILKTTPPFSVKSPDDLDRIPNGRFRLKLDPDAQFMRDNGLLERIAEIAKRDGHSVEVRGSGLCHAYYLLTSLGVSVLTPFTRRHTRVRGRQVFGKLVRDNIPDRIRSHGERVAYFSISPSDRRRALSAKLMEEAQEVANSTNSDDISSELADVFEIVRSIASQEKIEWSEVEDKANAKRDKIGAFDQGRILIETDIPTGTRKSGGRKPSSSIPYETREHDNGITIPFLALMEDEVEFNYRGRIYIMRLRQEGVYLEEIGERDTITQLPLPFVPDDSR